MKKNNRGFTLVELLAVIAIVAILSGVAIMAVSRYSIKVKKQAYANYEKRIEDSFKNYVVKNSFLVSFEEPLVLDTDQLKENKLIEELIDPEDNSKQCTSIVVASVAGSLSDSDYDADDSNTMNTEYQYNICLMCSNYKSSTCSNISKVSGYTITPEPSVSPSGTTPGKSKTYDQDSCKSLMYGDMNCDGEVTLLDITILARYLANWEGYDLNDQQLLNADANNDGLVTDKDRLIISRHVAEWDGYETLPKSEFGYSTIKGDVNFDGKVTNNDVLLVSYYLAGGDSLKEQSIINADVNSDNKVDDEDVKLMKGLVCTKYSAYYCFGINKLLGYNYIQASEDPIPSINGEPAKPAQSQLFDTEYETCEVRSYGDVNCDGIVNRQDVLTIAVYISNPSGTKLSDQQLLNADLDDDGDIDQADRSLIASCAAGDCESLPVLSANTYSKGDVNLDGNIDYKDVMFIKLRVKGYIYLTRFSRENADINNDGVINNTDANLLDGMIS